jgi:hypothetical protein
MSDPSERRRLRHYLDPAAPFPAHTEPRAAPPADPDHDVTLWLEHGDLGELVGWHGTLERAESGHRAVDADLHVVLRRLLVESGGWRECDIRVWSPAQKQFPVVGRVVSPGLDLEAVAALVLDRR